MKTTIGVLRKLIRETLSEVDTDPSNNPGRPADPFEYLGMRPNPSAAMAHPALGGGAPGGGEAGDGTSVSDGGEDSLEPTEAP